MELESLRTFLGWCTLINFGLLLWWWLWIALAGDWVYRSHVGFIRIQLARPVFDAVHYAGMSLFKILVILLNVVPYLALRFVL